MSRWVHFDLLIDLQFNDQYKMQDVIPCFSLDMTCSKKLYILSKLLQFCQKFDF